MTPKGAVDNPAVTQEKVDRRIAEYRDQGFERRAMPHIIYHGEHISCPWPGCAYRIAGIDFQLEKLNDPSRYNELLAGWWQGAGLVGQCPGCGQYVLYGMAEKRAIQDPAAEGLVLLPDNWHQTAYIV